MFGYIFVCTLAFAFKAGPQNLGNGEPMINPMCHLLTLFLVVSSPSQAPTPQVTEPLAFSRVLAKEFSDRVVQYTRLKDGAGAGLPQSNDKMLSPELAQRSATLRNHVRRLRSNAVRGEIFTTEIAVEMKRVFRDDGSNLTGREAMAIALEKDNPPNSVPEPTVNDEYPSNLGLVSPSPTTLTRLPELPKGLEYRLIGPHLILRDIETNLIVDVAPNVLVRG